MRKYFAEYLGTALLVFVGTGSIVFTSTERIASPITVALAFGFALMAAIYAFGDVSGGHFNPAVSFAMAINKRMSWNNFIGYIISQILGALTGTILVIAMLFPYVNSPAIRAILGGYRINVFGRHGFIANIGLGETDFARGQWLGATFAEIILTFFFILVILNLTSSKYTDNRLAGVVIGLTISILIMIGLPIDGGSLNPARSISPAIFVQGHALTGILVYIVGPIIGAWLAAIVAKRLMSTENDHLKQHSNGATIAATKTQKTAKKTTTRKSIKNKK